MQTFTFQYLLTDGILLDIEASYEMVGADQAGSPDVPEIDEIICTLAGETVELSGLFKRRRGTDLTKPLQFDDVYQDIEEEAYEKMREEGI